MLFHCLYQHPFSDKKMEERLWNVACDLAVELLIWQNIPEIYGSIRQKNCKKKTDF